MTDVFSKQKRSEVMATVKSKNSKIERIVAKTLKDKSLRYRLHSKVLPGKPDFYFTKLKTVIFVDSCFWHGCRYHGTKPQTNSEFWENKIARNKARDREVNLIYKKMGWKVIRIWEHQIFFDTNRKILDKIASLVQ